MKGKYEKPILEFNMFEIEDVITTSCAECYSTEHSTLEHYLFGEGEVED